MVIFSRDDDVRLYTDDHGNPVKSFPRDQPNQNKEMKIAYSVYCLCSNDANCNKYFNT